MYWDAAGAASYFLPVIPCIAQRRHGMTCMDALISARAKDGEAEKCMDALISARAKDGEAEKCMDALISARAKDGEAEKCMEALMSAVARECGAGPVSLGLVTLSRRAGESLFVMRLKRDE